MAHWAELDENNIVTRVLVGDNNDPAGDEGYSWLIENLGGTWIKASYNTVSGKRINQETGELTNESGFRGNFPGVGFKYYEDIDAFIEPCPEEFPSWIIDTENYIWIPPVPKPDSGTWIWDEETISWKEYDPE